MCMSPEGCTPEKTRAMAGHGTPRSRRAPRHSVRDARSGCAGCALRGRAAAILVAMPYEVSTAVFEGPFDLLLHLITREEVDLYEVSLSRIVDAYVAEIARMDRLDLDVATEFVLIAATRIELKIRR